MAGKDKLVVKIGGDTTELKNAILQGNNIVNKFAAGVQNVRGQIIGAFAVNYGIQGLASAVRSSVESLAQFESTMSAVKAVTQSSDQDFQKLKASALSLAMSYGKTSTEVAKLQLEYGRLGLSTTEILQSSKAAILLSKATGEDLANSAIIAGSTLRAFNLDASQMDRVADVMAASFNKSALSLSDFGEAIKYVAPVAANAGLSIEQVAAMLGVLADNGIKGSMAGTSLRKIISDLGQGAAPVLTKRLSEMAESGLSGAQAMDEVGRTAYASLLILSKNTEKVDQSTVAYKNSTGELQKMSDIMQNNLMGDWQKFTGALDSTIQKGDGVIVVFRGIVQSMTTLVTALGNFKSEMALIGQAISPFHDLKNVSKETLDYLLQFARTDTGKRVADVLKPITDQSTVDFLKNAKQNYKLFFDLLRKEGESVDDINVLFTHYVNKQIAIFRASKTATPAIQEQTSTIQQSTAAYDQLIKRISDASRLQASIDKITQSKPPEIPGGKIANPFVSQMSNMRQAWTETKERMAADFAEMQAQYTQMANVATASGQVIGAALVGAFSGDQGLGQLRQATVSIVNLFQQQALAAIVAKATKDGVFKPGVGTFVAIAAATAGFAAIKALFSKIGATGGGAGGGGGYGGGAGGGGTRFESLGQRIELVGQVAVSGTQLNIALSNQARLDNRTKAG